MKRCDEMRRFVSFRLILFRARYTSIRVQKNNSENNNDVDDISQPKYHKRDKNCDNKSQHARIEIHIYAKNLFMFLFK